MKIKEIIDTLAEIDAAIASHITDEQDYCEARCIKQGLRGDDKRDDGTPIVYPENAAPELDSARSHIQNAVDDLFEWQDYSLYRHRK